jgi:phospholipid/cholesterol/gamma-HCH transport system substrate-binding protein
MSRSFRVGVFVVGTLAVLALGVFLIGDQQLLFSHTYQLKATFKNVEGLNNGGEVRVGGIHKGTVKQIQLPTRSDGGMTVVMNIENSTRKVVKQDSVASIQTEGLMGSKYVEISFGTDSAPPVENGATITGAPPLDISDLIQKTNGILDTVQDSTSHIKEISSKIDQGKGTMGALVNDKKMYDQLNATAAEAKSGATAFQENMTALKTNFFLRGFFNRRGYDDSAKLTEHDISDIPQSPYQKKFAYDAKDIFDKPQSAKLKNQKALNDAGRFLEMNPFGLAVVAAYGAMKGDTDETQVLTEARAMVIRDYLVKNFKMDDTLLKTKGMGKSELYGRDAGSVEIIIYPLGYKARTSTSTLTRRQP